MKIRKNTYKVMTVLLISQILSRLFYRWVDWHIGGLFAGIATTYLQFAGFLVSVIMLIILSRVSFAFIAALLAQVFEVFAVIKAYYGGSKQSLVSNTSDGLVGLRIAEMAGVIVMALILVGIVSACGDMKMKKLSLIMFPVVIFVVILYLGTWIQMCESSYNIVESLSAIDPLNLPGDMADNLNMGSLIISFITGDLDKELFDAAFPNVRDAYSSFFSNVIWTFILRIVLTVVVIVSFVIEFTNISKIKKWSVQNRLYSGVPNK